MPDRFLLPLLLTVWLSPACAVAGSAMPGYLAGGRGTATGIVTAAGAAVSKRALLTAGGERIPIRHSDTPDGLRSARLGDLWEGLQEVVDTAPAENGGRQTGR